MYLFLQPSLHPNCLKKNQPFSTSFRPLVQPWILTSTRTIRPMISLAMTQVFSVCLVRAKGVSFSRSRSTLLRPTQFILHDLTSYVQTAGQPMAWRFIQLRRQFPGTKTQRGILGMVHSSGVRLVPMTVPIAQTGSLQSSRLHLALQGGHQTFNST